MVLFCTESLTTWLNINLKTSFSSICETEIHKKLLTISLLTMNWKKKNSFYAPKLKALHNQNDNSSPNAYFLISIVFTFNQHWKKFESQVVSDLTNNKLNVICITTK